MCAKALDIARAARAYVGMEFRAQGRSHPGDGPSARIDCAGLLVCVAEDLELADKMGCPFERKNYSHRGGQPMNDEILQECERRLIRKDLTQLAAGDVVCLRAPESISHCGIISDFNRGGYELGLIFAYPVRMAAKRLAGSAVLRQPARQGRIVEVGLDRRWRSRIAAVFTWPGVAQ